MSKCMKYKKCYDLDEGMHTNLYWYYVLSDI